MVNIVSEYSHIQRASENSKDIDKILSDAYRLLSRFYSIIRSSALHVYHSALNFTPLGTRLHQTYSGRFPNRIIARQGVPQHWSSLVAILHGHSDSVDVLSFSPDGSRLASGSLDKTVRLWNGSTGVLIATLEGHSECVQSLSFSPDGSRLASGSYDNTVKLWGVASGVPIATLEGHSDSVASLSFSPDGSRLASGYHDKTVRLWDVASGVPTATLEGHSHSVASLTFSPDGSRLASWSYGNGAILWDCATGVSTATIKGGPQSVYSLLRSPLSVLASRPTVTVLSHHDDDADASFSTLNINSDRLLSSEMLSMSLCKSDDPSRHYYIQGTVPSSNGHVPLLWLPVDTPEISKEAFCQTAAAFGCIDGRVIILDRTQLNLQEAV